MKQDVLIAVVSVLAIVYVIVFDGTVDAGPNRKAVRMVTSTDPGVAARPQPEAPHLVTSALEPSSPETPTLHPLTISAEGSPTPAARDRLIEEAQEWVKRPLPGELAHLAADSERIAKLAATLERFKVDLEPALATAFGERVTEFRRTYLLQKTTADLTEVADLYVLPGTSDRRTILDDLRRLTELARDVEWVEQTYSFQYPTERRAHLGQLIEVLSGMARLDSPAVQ